MNKHFIKEYEELKKELKRCRDVFLETIEKWEGRTSSDAYPHHDFPLKHKKTPKANDFWG
jgi:hypothetical protein